MSITVYNDVIVPNSVLSLGISGKQMRNNTRNESANGNLNINVNWSKTLREYQVGLVPMLPAVWRQLEGMHEVTDGGAFGMLMQDPKDSNVATGEGFMQGYTTALVGTTGLGYGVPTLKLLKRYTSLGSSRFRDRRITRPMTTPVPVLKRDAATMVAGAGAGQYALNSDTGTVTMIADASQAIQSINVGATTELVFSSGTGVVAAMSVGERVYVTGVTGTAATILNSLSHEVTIKGATSLTISTVTTGLTVTAPGTAARYPQASEALTFTGSFYVPVHFANDDIDWSLLSGGHQDVRLMTGPSVTLREVRE